MAAGFTFRSFSELASRLSGSAFARGAVVLSTGTMIAQLIGVAATPVLSRLFTPADFGLLALFTAVTGIGATIITLRYEVRIVPAKSHGEARAVLRLVLALAVCAGSTLALLAYLLPQQARISLQLADLGDWLPAAFLMSMVTATVVAVSYWFNRFGEYRKLASLRVVQALLSAACGLIAGFLAIRDGLIYATVVATAVGLVPYLHYGLTSLASVPGSESMAHAARANRRAPFFLLPTALMDVLTLQLPFFLISMWFSIESTGQYRMAWTILALPGALVGHAIAQVFFQRYSDVWPDAHAARALLVKSWKTLALLGLGPLIVVLSLGEFLFSFVLGEPWREAGLIGAYLAPMVFVSLIHSPTSTTFIVMGMERTVFFFGLAVLVYRPACLYAGHLVGSLYVGLALFVFIEIVQMVIFQAIAYKKVNARLRAQG